MRPLRCSINVALDGCCDHQVMIPDEVQPVLAGQGPTLFAGQCERLERQLVGRQELRVVALRCQPSRVTA